MSTDSEKPDYLGHRQRLRQRFLLGEGKDMADYELLELVLTMAIPRRDVKPLAKQLVKKFGSFAGVINARPAELLAEDGVKENTLAMLKVIKAAAVRTSWQNLNAAEGSVFDSLDVLLDYCRSSMSFSDVEELHVLLLDSKLRIIKEELMQRGTINCVAIHPREIIKAALDVKATAVIMIHNHPSGNVTPSRADIDMTRNVREACKSVNITLCDHLIISRNAYYSFSEHINL